MILIYEKFFGMFIQSLQKTKSHKNSKIAKEMSRPKFLADILIVNLYKQR